MSEQRDRDQVAPIPHPLADRIRERHVEVETRAPVMFLGSAQADLLQRTARQNRPLVIVSDEFTGLTHPFAHALRERRGSWVVRAPGNALRDGFTGRRLEAVADVLEPVPWDGSDVAVRHLRPAGADQLELGVVASVRHRPELETRLGGAAELITLRLQGDPPAAWDVLEPVAEEWDREAMTEYARRHIHDDPRLIVRGRSGRSFIATIDVARSQKGVQETTRAFAVVGPLDSPQAEEALAAAPSVLTELHERATPLIGMVLARPQRADQLIRPLLNPPPSPVAMLIGPIGVAMLQLDAQREVAERGAMVIGRPRIPGLLYTFGPPGAEAVERLLALLSSLDESRVREAFGGSSTLPWERG